MTFGSNNGQISRITDNTGTPEAGTVSFLYNSYSLVSKRTDARAISKNFSYDGLNRLTQATYTDSTPTVSLTYGTSAPSNNKGRLITVIYNGSSNTESFTYDVLGRITQATKKIDNVNYAISYAYNLASELASITYPSGRVATQSYDTIGRLSTIASGGVNYASGFGYNAAGRMGESCSTKANSFWQPLPKRSSNLKRQSRQTLPSASLPSSAIKTGAAARCQEVVHLTCINEREAR